MFGICWRSKGKKATRIIEIDRMCCVMIADLKEKAASHLERPVPAVIVPSGTIAGSGSLSDICRTGELGMWYVQDHISHCHGGNGAEQ